MSAFGAIRVFIGLKILPEGQFCLTRYMSTGTAQGVIGGKLPIMARSEVKPQRLIIHNIYFVFDVNIYSSSLELALISSLVT